MLNTAPDVLPVAVGVLICGGKVLVSQRPFGVHLSEYWEFPGGKIEPGESLQEALTREFEEELSIGISAIRPLMEINYRYPEKLVCLKVCRIGNYSGEPEGREGQKVRWCDSEQIGHLRFPPANTQILEYVRREIQSA